MQNCKFIVGYEGFHSYQVEFVFPSFTILCFSPPQASAVESDKEYYKKLISRIMRRHLNGITFAKNGDDTELVTLVNHNYPIISRVHNTGQPMDSLNCCASPAFSHCCDKGFEKALTLCIKLYDKRFKDKIAIGISASTQQLTMLDALFKQASEVLWNRFWDTETCVFL